MNTPTIKTLSSYLTQLAAIVDALPKETSSSKAVADGQLKALNLLLRYASEHSDYWGEVIRGRQLGSLEEIQELPVTTRRDILVHHTTPLTEALRAGIPSHRIKTPMMTTTLDGLDFWKTSGSTGMPTVLVRDRNEVTAACEVIGHYLREVIPASERIINLFTTGGTWLGAPYTREFLNAADVATGFYDTDGSFDDLLHELGMFGYTGIAGLPSTVAEFLSWAERSGKAGEVPPIGTFLFGGEPLSTNVFTADGETQKLGDYLRRRWSTTILPMYSGTEILMLGFPQTSSALESLCYNPAHRLGHIEYDAIPELPDSYEVISTTFFNATVPLLRFATGDVVVGANNRTVDREFTFASFGNRRDDSITLASCNLYGAGMIADRLMRQVGRRVQIEARPDELQSGNTALVIRTDQSIEEGSKDLARQLVKNALTELADDRDMRPLIARMHISFETPVLVTSTGKFRRVINRF